MAWIKEISKEDSKTLKDIYERSEKRTGEPVANVLKAHSLSPETLEAHMRLYETVMFNEGALSRTHREMIGVVVSKANECPYCVTHHNDALLLISRDKERLARIAEDYENADLTTLEKRICDYAVKLTKTPYKMMEEDIQGLRDAGLDDLGIFEVNQTTAYYCYVNRIVSGLGVELETDKI